MGYMDKWFLKIQGQFNFLKLGGVAMEHGLHLGSEGGVLGARPNPGQM